MYYVKSVARRCFVLVVIAGAALGAVVPASPVTREKATGRIFCRVTRFLVPYQAADPGPSGIRAVRLYCTTDNGYTWTLHGEKSEAEGSFEFVASADGTYGFTTRAIDNAGNMEGAVLPDSGTAAEIEVVVDTRAPQIEAIFPRQDVELAPGAHVAVRFRADDPNLLPSSADVKMKREDEKDWSSFPNIGISDGEFYGRGGTLSVGSYQVSIRISDRAGNSATELFTFTCTKHPRRLPRKRGQAGSDWLVPVGAPPRARSLVFSIDYQVSDIGGQPPESVGLYYTSDDGLTWQFYGLDPDAMSPFEFQAPKAGYYGFKIVAKTRSGVSEPRPQTGTKPEFITLVDDKHPTLMLEEPRGGESVPGGEPAYIRWSARDDHLGSLPITIYVSRDGGRWELLAAELPNTGAYGWNVPLIDYAAYRLKVEARDIVGNTTTYITEEPFYVVSTPPESTIRGISSGGAAVAVSQVGEEALAAQEPSGDGAQPTSPAVGAHEAEVKAMVEASTALRLKGDYEGAERVLRDALGLDAYSVRAKNELGALLVLQRRHSEAVELLRSARASAPRDTQVLYNLAAAYYALGKFVESAAAFESLAELKPRDEEVVWLLSKAYFAANDRPAARQSWQRLVAMNVPGSPYGKMAREALDAVPPTSVGQGSTTR